MRHRRELQFIRNLKMDVRNKRTALHVHKRLKHRFTNITIKELRELYIEYGILDPTFKWDRRMERVQWSYVNGIIGN